MTVVRNAHNAVLRIATEQFIGHNEISMVGVQWRSIQAQFVVIGFVVALKQYCSNAAARFIDKSDCCQRDNAGIDFGGSDREVGRRMRRHGVTNE